MVRIDMKRELRLSLIVATYNRAEQLMVTLRSIAMQRAAAELWECIVVDNNSKDNTAERVEEFRLTHPKLNIVYVREGQQGLSYARNAGIRVAQGDILAFVDDDERIVEGFIGAYIELFDSYSDAMSAGGRIVAEYPTGRPRWMSRYTEQPIANPMDFGCSVRLFPKGRIPGGGNMAMRREFFERVGVFDTELGRKGGSLIGGEESDIFERAEALGFRCYYVPDAVMYHIIPETKLTEEYFERLCYNTGVSQRMRAERHNRVLRQYVAEVLKWCATALLAFVHRPKQTVFIIKMRRKISQGLFYRKSV